MLSSVSSLSFGITDGYFPAKPESSKNSKSSKESDSSIDTDSPIDPKHLMPGETFCMDNVNMKPIGLIKKPDICFETLSNENGVIKATPIHTFTYPVKKD